MTIVILLLIAANCFSQEVYECHSVQNQYGGTPVALAMKITVLDSLIKIEYPSKPMVSFKRLPSKFDVYFSNGGKQGSLSILPMEGKARDLSYNCIVTIIPDLKSPAKNYPNNYCTVKAK